MKHVQTDKKKKKTQSQPDLRVESTSLNPSEKDNKSVQEVQEGSIIDKLRNTGVNYNPSFAYLLKNPNHIHGISTAGAKYLQFISNQYKDTKVVQEKLRKTLFKNSLETQFNFNKFPPFINKPVMMNQNINFDSQSEKSRQKMIQREFSKLKVNLQYQLSKKQRQNFLRSFISKHFGEIDITEEELMRFEYFIINDSQQDGKLSIRNLIGWIIGREEYPELVEPQIPHSHKGSAKTLNSFKSLRPTSGKFGKTSSQTAFNSTNTFHNYVLNPEAKQIRDPNEVQIPRQVEAPSVVKKQYGVSRNEEMCKSLNDLNSSGKNTTLKENILQDYIVKNQHLKSVESMPLSIHEQKQKITQNSSNVLTLKTKLNDNKTESMIKKNKLKLESVLLERMRLKDHNMTY